MTTLAPPPRSKLTVEIVLRSMLFTVWVYGLGAVMGLACLPLLAAPRPTAIWAVRTWSRLVIGGLKRIVGANVEVRGLEHLRPGPCLIAAKHQGMFDIIPPFDYLPDPCLVMKRELMMIPVFGWFCAKLQMIVVNRKAASKALRAMVHDATDALAQGRQIIIFPEGTRKAPGAPPDYKPGIAALYRELNVPCTPIATNSGEVWPAHGFIRYPGTAVFEILPPIQAGLKRATFMALLEDAVEGATARLVAERRPLKEGEIARPLSHG
jgi:1-acyl-sn-glycerol-3-phosphate acyltransferase